MRRMNRPVSVLLALALCTECLAVSPKPVRAVPVSAEAEWNISRIHAEDSYNDSRKLPKIKVALLDSGLDTDEDIPFAERKDFLGEEEIHSIYQDTTGHGTGVAGIICAEKSEDRICGIASNVELYVARVLDSSNQAPVDRIVEAIDWAVQKKVNIIHMSFGTRYYSEELEEAIKKAYQNNILIVASAGNDGNAAEDESTIEYPAAFDEVLSVGATNSENAVTEFSSTGEELDVVAPGDRVLSIGVLGGVMVEKGTSISAAHVTGVAAVLWGKHPGASNEFIKSLLSGSANASAITGDCGSGIIDYEQTESNYKKMSDNYRLYKSKGYSEAAAVEKAKDTLEVNRKKIPESGRVNYVNGAWAVDTHIGYVGDGAGEVIKTGQDIEIVKAGASVPDIVDSMKVMSKHPCFHGGGYYFSDLAYLYDMAKKYFEAKEGEQVRLPGVDNYYDNDKKLDEINQRFPNRNIQKELTACQEDFFNACRNRLVQQNKMEKGEALTNRQKGYALLGAALHGITDAIAHQGCRFDKKYGTGFSRIVHSRINGSLDRPEDGIKGNVNYYQSELWRRYKSGEFVSQEDRDYYEYLLDNYAIADDAEKFEERGVLSSKISKAVVTSFQSGGDYRDMLANLKNPLTDLTDPKEKALSSEYRLLEMNNNWQTAGMEAENFTLDIAKGDVAKGAKLPEDGKVSVSIKGGKIKIRFPAGEKCRYRLYCEDRAATSDTAKYIYFNESTNNKKKIFTIKKGQLKGNTYYISVFYGSKRVLEERYIKKKVVYKRVIKKKEKKKQRVIPYAYAKKKIKLEGSIFKLGKKYKLVGWTKKKNAKKKKYGPNGSVRFQDNKTLVLYALVKKKKAKKKGKQKKKGKKK